jgi:uncharacterized Ntn-hydrolase superfamily protein
METKSGGGGEGEEKVPWDRGEKASGLHVLQALHGWLDCIESVVDVQVTDTHPQSIAKVRSGHEREEEIEHERKVFRRDVNGDAKNAARYIRHLETNWGKKNEQGDLHAFHDNEAK